jgi:hypothetical protein
LYNKPSWIRYIRRHQPPGPIEEEEEEEEEEDYSFFLQILVEDEYKSYFTV